jgi:hypothetical protein
MVSEWIGRLVRGLGLAVYIVIASGCVSISGGDLPARLAVKEGAPAGYVALSMGGRKIEGRLPPFQEHLLRFRPVGERSGGQFSTFVKSYDLSYDHGFDVADGEWFVDSIAVRLAPGRYEIYALEMRSSAGTITQTLLPDIKFSIPFEIRDGHVTYLGGYVGHSTMGRNFVGMEVRTGAFFRVFDQQARDLAFLVRKGAVPDGLPVDRAVPATPMADGLFQP